MKKNKEELLTLFGEILEEKGLLKTCGLHEVNHKPHVYMVGPKHVAKAADENGGVLSEDILETMPCAHRKCKLSYREHTSEQTLMLTLTRDILNSEANDELMKLKDQLIVNQVAGVSFVENEVNETDTKIYRFIPDEESE